MIVTFYSFKGGSGRTLAVANVAVLLARQGHRVLAVDFDLEAPGLSRYLRSQARAGVRLEDTDGLLDLLVAARSREPGEPAPDWRRYVVRLTSAGGGALDVLTSGRGDDGYAARVLGFEWDAFFAEHAGGDFIEAMRDGWRDEYDFVLVDSRTGITDTGGICTIQLPDVIVAVFTASDQSIDGLVDVVDRAQRARQALAYDRARLSVVPLPSRFESKTEYELAHRWLDRFAKRFAGYYRSWVPRDVPVRLMLERTALPYVPFFSYGEPLPVLTEGTSAPGSLGYMLGTLARLLAGRLANAKEIAYGDAPGSSRPDVSRLIEASDDMLDRADPAVAERAWQALRRMVRPSVGDLAEVTFEPDTLDLADVADEEVLALLRELPAVRVVGNAAVWADDEAVRWHVLQDHVRRRLDFFLSLREVRDRRRGGEPLTDGALVEAVYWLDRRWEEFLPGEREYVQGSARRSAAADLATFRRAQVLLAGLAAALVAVIATIGAVTGNLAKAEGATLQAVAVASNTILFGLVAAGVLELARRRHRRVTRSLPDGGRVLEKVIRALERMGYEATAETRTRTRFQRSAGEPLYLLNTGRYSRESLVISAPMPVLRDLYRRVPEAATLDRLRW